MFRQLQNREKWLKNKRGVLSVTFSSLVLLAIAIFLVETKSTPNSNIIAFYSSVIFVFLGILIYWLSLNEIIRVKKISIELKQQKELLRITVNSITEGLITTGKKGEILFMNPAAERITGWKNGEVRNFPLKKVYDVVNEETGRPFENIVSRIIREGKTVELENNTILKTKYLDQLIISNSGSPLFDVNGNISGSVLVFNDITERKRVENKLKDREKQYRDLIQNLPEAVYTCDEFGFIQLYNKAAVALWGREPIAGSNKWCGFSKIFTTSGVETSADAGPMAITIKKERPVHGEQIMVQRLDGSLRHILPYATPLFDDNGRLTGAVNMLIDITEKNEKEILVRQTEEKYRSLVEYASDAVIIYSFDGTIYEFNQAVYKLTGYSRDEFEKLKLQDILFEEVVVNPGNVERMRSGETVLFNRKVKRKNGTALEVEINSKILPDGRTLAFVRDVTTRKKAEQQLAESEKNLRYVLSSASESFYVIDRRCYVTLINKTAASNLEKAWGTPVVVGTNILDVIPNENEEPTRSSLVKVFAGNEVEYELNLSVKDLPSRVLVHYTPVIDEDEKVVGAYITTKDITERKKAAEAIRESNERYELATKATSDVIWDWNLLTGEIYRNKEGWKQMFRIKTDSGAEGMEAEWFRRIHPDDLAKANQIMQQVFQSDNFFQFEVEYRMLRDDNTYAYTLNKANIIRNELGKPERIVGAIQDITERKQNEEELKKLSLIARETGNSVVITDKNENIIWVNEAFTRITEFEFAEAIGKKPGSFLQGLETNAAVVRFMRLKIKKAQPFECDVINYTKSGKKYWLRIQCQPQFDATGALTNFFSIQTDITKEKEAEETLKSSEERYRHLFNNNPESIIIWDVDSLRILEVNDTALYEYGYKREEFVQLTMLDLRPEEEYEKIRAFAKQMKDNPVKRSAIWRHCNKAGEDLYMNIISDQIAYKGKTAILAIADNVTEKIKLEDQLENERILKQQEINDAVLSAQENERQEIGRELHDNINQILASSRLYLGMARKESEDSYACLEETDNLINTAIEEIRMLSHSLIPPSLSESELIEALNDIIATTAATTSITIQKEFTGFDEKTISDKFKLALYRIVQEQFNNILKYASAKNIFLKLLYNDKVLLLSIKDDGVGFDTAKKSNGVGLMNIKTRASLFNGEMNVISSPGNGCELTVTFKQV